MQHRVSTPRILDPYDLFRAPWLSNRGSSVSQPSIVPESQGVTRVRLLLCSTDLCEGVLVLGSLLDLHARTRGSL